MPKLKAVVTIAVWILFIKGFLNVVLSLVMGFTNMQPMPIAEAMGGYRYRCPNFGLCWGLAKRKVGVR